MNYESPQHHKIHQKDQIALGPQYARQSSYNPRIMMHIYSKDFGSITRKINDFAPRLRLLFLQFIQTPNAFLDVANYIERLRTQGAQLA